MGSGANGGYGVVLVSKKEMLSIDEVICLGLRIWMYLLNILWPLGICQSGFLQERKSVDCCMVRYGTTSCYTCRPFLPNTLGPIKGVTSDAVQTIAWRCLSCFLYKAFHRFIM